MDEFHIIINRRHFDASTTPLTGLDILALAGYGPDYQLYELRGEGDPSGGRLVGPQEPVALKNGLHFRAVPGNANFG